MKTLVTGAKGFVGKNLVVALKRRVDVDVMEYDIDSPAGLEEVLTKADVVYHLAGVNRPLAEEEFHTVNTGSTEEICRMLAATGRRPKIVFSSSIQAELDNPYGISKRNAEDALKRFSKDAGVECVVYRFKNLFGKWCRPNYNSVTATFCHNIAHDLPIQISDGSREIDLTSVADVVVAFVNELDAPSKPGFRFAQDLPSYRISLGELAALIQSFRVHRRSLLLPDFSSWFVRLLYATYLSYLETDQFNYGLDINIDERGSLAEFLKSPGFGQLFVSHTRPGVTRGNHYHDAKTEKFLVVEGEAIIRFRHIENEQIIEYKVRGEDYRVLDIPPGYTHSIENVGKDDLVTLFWASEVFDPSWPDTFFDLVVKF